MGAFKGVVAIAVGLFVVLIVAAGMANTPQPATPVATATPLTFSGVGHKNLGTITVPSGGAKMYWNCPSCDGILTVLLLNEKDTSDLGTMSMLMPYQDHPTYGANNSVEPGVYHDVTASAYGPGANSWHVAGAWTITVVPNVVGQTITVR